MTVASLLTSGSMRIVVAGMFDDMASPLLVYRGATILSPLCGGRGPVVHIGRRDVKHVADAAPTVLVRKLPRDRALGSARAGNHEGPAAAPAEVALLAVPGLPLLHDRGGPGGVVVHRRADHVPDGFDCAAALGPAQLRHVPFEGDHQVFGVHAAPIVAVYRANNMASWGHMYVNPGLTEPYGIALDSHSLDDGALEPKRPFE